jgi:hypothetical protein
LSLNLLSYLRSLGSWIGLPITGRVDVSWWLQPLYCFVVLVTVLFTWHGDNKKLQISLLTGRMYVSINHYILIGMSEIQFAEVVCLLAIQATVHGLLGDFRRNFLRLVMKWCWYIECTVNAAIQQ